MSSKPTGPTSSAPVARNKARNKAEAARANGAKSQGPVTAGGRAVSSRNSLRHGLSAKVLVLPHESGEEFEALRDSYVADFAPATAAERDLVEALAATQWRLRRLYSIEAKMLDNEMQKRERRIAREGRRTDGASCLAWVFQKMSNDQKCLTMVLRYEGTLTRSYDRAFRQLETLQAARAKAQPLALQNEPKNAAMKPDAVKGPSVSSAIAPDSGAAPNGIRANPSRTGSIPAAQAPEKRANPDPHAAPGGDPEPSYHPHML